MTGPEAKKLREWLQGQKFLSLLVYRAWPKVYRCMKKRMSWRRLVALLVLLLLAYLLGEEALTRRYTVTVLFVLFAMWGYYQRDLEIVGLPKLWKWIERRYPHLYKRLPSEPVLRPLDIEQIGWERYVHIKAARWLNILFWTFLALILSLWRIFTHLF